MMSKKNLAKEWIKRGNRMEKWMKESEGCGFGFNDVFKPFFKAIEPNDNGAMEDMDMAADGAEDGDVHGEADGAVSPKGENLICKLNKNI
jgi:hypothetical protein